MATSFRSSLYTCGLRESLHFASGEYLREGNYNRFPRQLYSTYCNSFQIYSEEGTNFCQNMSVKLLFFNNTIFQLMSLGHCWWTRKTGFLHRILKPFFMQILRKKKTVLSSSNAALSHDGKQSIYAETFINAMPCLMKDKYFLQKCVQYNRLHNKLDMVCSRLSFA